MTSRTTFCRSTLALAAATLLAACAATPEPAPERLPVPDGWRQAGDGAAADAARVDETWWQSFGSSRLGGFIAESDAHNSDLRIALESVRQAELALRVAGASRWPTVGASASSSRTRTEPDGGSASTSRRSSAGLSVSYEADLWGRLAAGVDAGEATLAASRLDLQASRTSIRAGVASSYWGWLAGAERLRVARDNLAAARRILAIVEARHAGGLQTSVEVAQQRTLVRQREAALIPLELALQQDASALALLLGRVPQQAPALGDEALTAIRVPGIAADLPAEALSRRPDVAAAEARLAAADADVRAARAALLPTLTLSASGTLASDVLLDLADPTRSVALAASLAQTLFDAGRRDAAVEQSRSARRVLIERYAATLRTALKEIDDGLGQVRSAERQEAAQAAVVEQAERTLRLAQVRLQAGAGDLLTVLQAQQTLFSAQDTLVTLRLARLNAAVDLCVALGGGWRS